MPLPNFTLKSVFSQKKACFCVEHIKGCMAAAVIGAVLSLAIAIMQAVAVFFPAVASESYCIYPRP